MIDVVLIGRVNRQQLADVIAKTEGYIERKIRPMILTAAEFSDLINSGVFSDVLKLWGDSMLSGGTRGSCDARIGAQK